MNVIVKVIGADVVVISLVRKVSALLAVNAWIMKVSGDVIDVILGVKLKNTVVYAGLTPPSLPRMKKMDGNIIMPYNIDKVKGGFVVKDVKGRKFSNKPLTKLGAQKQRIAIALSESRKTGKPASFFFA
jgi:hypothetical protein